MWAKGTSGNLNGRPTGTRDKFNQDFIQDLASDWADHGKDVLIKLRKTDPATYARLAASLVPKDIKIQHDVNIVTDIIKLAQQRQQEVLEARNTSERVIEHASDEDSVDTLEPLKEKVVNDK